MAASADSSSEMEDAHSPTIPQSSPSQPLLSTIPSANIAATTVENAASWIDDAMRQALVYQNTIVETLDSTINSSRTRLSQLRDTSIAYTSQTIVSESENPHYRHSIASVHPLINSSVCDDRILLERLPLSIAFTSIWCLRRLKVWSTSLDATSFQPCSFISQCGRVCRGCKRCCISSANLRIFSLWCWDLCSQKYYSYTSYRVHSPKDIYATDMFVCRDEKICILQYFTNVLKRRAQCSLNVVVVELCL